MNSMNSFKEVFLNETPTQTNGLTVLGVCVRVRARTRLRMCVCGVGV